MYPKQSVDSPFHMTQPDFTSLDAQTIVQPMLEPQTFDNEPFPLHWCYPSPTSDSAQQVATSSTSSLSLPSTPSTASSLIPSTPDNMQHYSIPASAMDVHDLLPAPAVPPRTPNGERDKVTRPINSFMLFRSWLIRSGKLPPGEERRQQNVSKIAGRAWRMLDEGSKSVWRDEASRHLKQHAKNHPDYKFSPSPKGRRTGLGKTENAANDSDNDATGTVCAPSRRAAGSRRSRRQRKRPSPYELPAAPQLTANLQSGSPPIPSLINFGSPLSSTHSLSPLAYHAQGVQQPHTPYVFLPPGLPNHFEQAYQHGDGKVLFSGNYAPVNPISPPAGYYPGRFPVANPSGMVMGPAVNNTATMLGLYDTNPPYAHFNPSIGAGWNGYPIQQPFVQTSPIPPNAPLDPLSCAPLTAHEQGVYGAMVNNSQVPFTLENWVSSPLSLLDGASLNSAVGSPATSGSPSPMSASTLAEEFSCINLQASNVEGSTPAVPQLNQCA